VWATTIPYGLTSGRRGRTTRWGERTTCRHGELRRRGRCTVGAGRCAAQAVVVAAERTRRASWRSAPGEGVPVYFVSYVLTSSLSQERKAPLPGHYLSLSDASCLSSVDLHILPYADSPPAGALAFFRPALRIWLWFLAVGDHDVWCGSGVRALLTWMPVRRSAPPFSGVGGVASAPCSRSVSNGSCGGSHMRWSQRALRGRGALVFCTKAAP
jgi:hypothetical protein